MNLREGGDIRPFLLRRHGATQVKYYRHLRVLYNWLLKQGWITKNPCDDIALERAPRREAHFLTKGEIERLTEYIAGHASDREAEYPVPMVRLVCQTGLRLGEVCALRWAWIKEDEIQLPCDSSFRTKSGREERSYMTEAARRILSPI